jgi:hypothetical protein
VPFIWSGAEKSFFTLYACFMERDPYCKNISW